MGLAVSYLFACFLLGLSFLLSSVSTLIQNWITVVIITYYTNLKNHARPALTQSYYEPSWAITSSFVLTKFHFSRLDHELHATRVINSGSTMASPSQNFHEDDSNLTLSSARGTSHCELSLLHKHQDAPIICTEFEVGPTLTVSKGKVCP
jgi:hypothetical protein